MFRPPSPGGRRLRRRPGILIHQVAQPFNNGWFRCRCRGLVVVDRGVDEAGAFVWFLEPAVADQLHQPFGTVKGEREAELLVCHLIHDVAFTVSFPGHLPSLHLPEQDCESEDVRLEAR